MKKQIIKPTNGLEEPFASFLIMMGICGIIYGIEQSEYMILIGAILYLIAAKMIWRLAGIR